MGLLTYITLWSKQIGGVSTRMNEERSLKNTSQFKEEGVPVVNYGTLIVKEIRGEGGCPLYVSR